MWSAGLMCWSDADIAACNLIRCQIHGYNDVIHGYNDVIVIILLRLTFHSRRILYFLVVFLVIRIAWHHVLIAALSGGDVLIAALSGGDVLIAALSGGDVLCLIWGLCV